MLKIVKCALFVAGLMAVQAGLAVADAPNNAIPRADSKIRGYQGSSFRVVTPAPVYNTYAVANTYSAPVAVSGRESYQSFSYNPGAGATATPVATPVQYYYAPAVAPIYSNTPPMFYRANRKISGKQFGY